MISRRTRVHLYLQCMSIDLYTSNHAGSEIAYHGEVVEEFDTLDRDEELEFHFAFPTIELLQLVGSIADGLQTIQLLYFCKTIPLTVRGRERRGGQREREVVDILAV